MKRIYSTMTAAQLQEWRRKRGVSVREAAEELGISERGMYLHLSGKRRVPLTLARLCWAFTSIEQLLEEIDRLERPSAISAEERKRLERAICTQPRQPS